MLHQIGAGALGPVFRAYHQEENRLVAIKLFRLDLAPERVHQLVAELEQVIGVDVSSRSLATPLATGITSNTAYLALDFVAGDSLDVVLRESGPSSALDVLRTMTPLAEALDAAAELGLVHGALHPRDVLVSFDDVRVTGLGVSRAVEWVGVTAPIRRPYTAPERAAGLEWDRRADVFSLAALFFDMLTGKRLNGVGAQATAALTGVPFVELSSLRDVMAKALDEEPHNRFATCEEFVEAFRGVTQEPRTKAPRRRKKASDDAAAAPLWSDALELPEEQPAASPGAAAEEDPELFASIPVSDIPAELFTANVTENPGRAMEVSADDAGFTAEIEHANDEGAPAPDDDLPLAADVARLSDERRLTDADVTPVATEPAADRLRVQFDNVRPAAEPAHAYEAHDTLRLSADRAPLTFVDKLEKTRSAMWPIVLSLVVGIAIGFGAAMMLLSRDEDNTLAAARAIPSKEVVEPPIVPTTESSPTSAAAPPAADASPAASAAAPPAATPATTATPTRAQSSGAEAPKASAPATHTPPPSAPPSATAPRAVTAPTPRATAPAAPGVSGQLQIRSTPSGARVSIDGKEAGTTPATIRGLAAGAHTVRVTRDGFQTIERRVTMSDRRPTESLTLTMTRDAAPAASAPVPAAARTGSLMVDSRPTGANVYVDGRLVGTTPLTLPAMAAGEHAVRLERAGYDRWTSTVRVTGGEQSKVAGSLTER